MAQEMRTVLVDDLDGSDADETFTFEFDGRSYKIDLTTEHADQLEEAFQLLDPFVDYFRQVPSSTRPRRSTRTSRPRTASATKSVNESPTGKPYDVRAIRAWAWENGIDVNNRGRIPETIIEKWRASLG